MTSPDFTGTEAERQAHEESERHTLLFADKKLLAKKQYPELLRGFHGRARLSMIAMGCIALWHLVTVTLQLVHATSAEEPPVLNSTVGWGKLLMVVLFGSMFVIALRDTRRCTRILSGLEEGSQAPRGST